MTLDQRAAFIWADGADINLLKQYVNKAIELGMTVKVWGCDNVKNDQFFRNYNNTNLDLWAGYPTFNNLDYDCFDHSFDMYPGDPNHGFLTGSYDRGWIVVFDHSFDTAGKFNFKIGDASGDYLYEYPKLKCWLDNPANMNVIDLCVVVLGGESGLALWELEGPDRIVITSMSANEKVLEHFNIAQYLDDSFNWRAAYEAERHRLANLTPVQTPQILPD